MTWAAKKKVVWRKKVSFWYRRKTWLRWFWYRFWYRRKTWLRWFWLRFWYRRYLFFFSLLTNSGHCVLSKILYKWLFFEDMHMDDCTLSRYLLELVQVNNLKYSEVFYFPKEWLKETFITQHQKEGRDHCPPFRF